MGSALRELARAAGLDPDYTSWRGEPTSASDEAVRKALRALEPDLGIDIEHPDAIAHLDQSRWAEREPPVVLAWDGELVVPFRVQAEVDDDWELSVVTESGDRFTARGRLFELVADSHAWPGGVVHCIRRARLSLGNALGYHIVTWRVAREQGEVMAVGAPTRAYGSPGNARKRWGVFAPVYGLASPTSGQAGDLGTLRHLFEIVERRGGSYVATLPMLAAFLDEPCSFSPYSPASRLFWNELYLDLPRFAEGLELTVPAAPPISTGRADPELSRAVRVAPPRDRHARVDVLCGAVARGGDRRMGDGARRLRLRRVSRDRRGSARIVARLAQRPARR